MLRNKSTVSPETSKIFRMENINLPTAAAVINFWKKSGPSLWFAADEKFDALLRVQFESLHFAVARGEYQDWERTAEGALALLLLTDQFPRNMYRRSAHAFATDSMALHIADRAIKRGFDKLVEEQYRQFFYLPFEHQESTGAQNRSLQLFAEHKAATGGNGNWRFAKLHAELIERFGRFPHRNKVMGRESTQEEIDYLAHGGFTG